jgi:hypothetical protein
MFRSSNQPRVSLRATLTTKRSVARGGPLKYRPYTAVVVRLVVAAGTELRLDADRRARRDNRRGADSNAATLRART